MIGWQQQVMTLKLTDFMNTRSHLLIFTNTNGQDVMYQVAEIMRRSLNWSGEEYQRQLNEYLELVTSVR